MARVGDGVESEQAAALRAEIDGRGDDYKHPLVAPSPIKAAEADAKKAAEKADTAAKKAAEKADTDAKKAAEKAEADAKKAADAAADGEARRGPGRPSKAEAERKAEQSARLLADRERAQVELERNREPAGFYVRLMFGDQVRTLRFETEETRKGAMEKIDQLFFARRFKAIQTADGPVWIGCANLSWADHYEVAPFKDT